MHRKVFKLLKRIIIVVVLLLILIITGTVVLKNKLLRMGIQAINNELVVPVQVNTIDFSLIRNFPYTSIVLNDVVILSPKTLNRDDFNQPYADTLLYIKNLYLSFNVRKIFNNQLELKAVKVNKGRFNILVDAKGNDNFHILKPKKESTNQSGHSIELMLKQLTLRQSRVIVHNVFKNNGIQCELPNFVVKGNYVNNLYQTETNGQLTLNWVMTNQVKIVPLAPTRIEMAVNINNDSISIVRGQLISRGLNFNISGNARFTEHTIVNLKIKGNQIELADLLKYFSMVSKKEKLTIKSTGVLNFDARINGQFDNTHTPLIAARFGIIKGTVDYPELNLSLKQIELKGGYNNGATSNGSNAQLSISNFSFRSQSSNFRGNFVLNNFKQPYVRSGIAFDGCLDEWNGLIFDTKEKLSGCIEGTCSMEGNVDLSEKLTIQSFLKLSPKAQIKLKKTGYDDNKNIQLDDLIGSVKLEGDSLELDKVAGKFGSTSFSFNGIIGKVFTSFFEPYPTMQIVGEGIADKLDYKQIGPFFEEETPETSKFTYSLKTRLFLNRYTDESFQAENISTILRYENEITTADNLNFYAFDGRVNTSLVFRPVGNDYLFTCQATIDQVDITKLFSTFKNFDQNYVTDKNINGKISGSFSTSLPFVKSTANWNKIEFLGHVKIIDGRLSDIQTTRKLAEFTKIDDFNNLEFSTLENDLLIKDATVSFSKMNIESNACDITLYGNYHFSGDYEYHFTMILTDFMRGKANRIRQEVTPYGIVENDGLGHTTLYLMATCKDGETKIRFDRQEVKQHLKEEMKQQKQEVKGILKKEFGLFKNDSTIVPKKKEKEVKKQFEIEWDDE